MYLAQGHNTVAPVEIDRLLISDLLFTWNLSKKAILNYCRISYVFPKAFSVPPLRKNISQMGNLSYCELAMLTLEQTLPHMSIFEPPHGKTICIGENKGADQRLCFRYSDSTVPLLLKSEISRF